MRLAQIKDGVVVNILEIDPDRRPDWCAGWPEAGNAGPGWLYADGQFSAPDEPEAPAPNLSPQQWAFFLDVSGFRAVLDQTLAGLPTETAEQRVFWAGLRAVAYASSEYTLSGTLALVGVIRDMGVQGVPDGQAIADAWPVAAAFRGTASLTS